MRLSNYFLPILREHPKEAEITSHSLMLRAGMIKQQSAGIYSWLPLGKRVLDKIIAIVKQEQDRAGFNELLMPLLQSAELWQESGRYDDYGLEMLRIVDRHERKMLYGPTNEEVITDIFRSYVRSYKELPVRLYQVQWKFRDEIRPRFGLMRGREFLMKDAYSFDIDFVEAKKTYNKMFVAYLRSFSRMGLRAIPMRADTGPIGGDLSHEFIILAKTGESAVFCDKCFLDYNIMHSQLDFNDDNQLNDIVSQWTKPYAATEEMHDEAAWLQLSEADRVEARGIEVGHIFHFGTKYSEPMNATVMDAEGRAVFPAMGSYGIGISRLVAAAIEASHDEDGIIWPAQIAPFDLSIINLRIDDELCNAVADKFYSFCSQIGLEALLDDSNERAGIKFASMDLLGLPYQLIIGPKGAATGMVEIKNRKSSQRLHLSIDEALNYLSTNVVSGKVS